MEKHLHRCNTISSTVIVLIGPHMFKGWPQSFDEHLRKKLVLLEKKTSEDKSDPKIMIHFQIATYDRNKTTFDTILFHRSCVSNFVLSSFSIRRVDFHC